MRTRGIRRQARRRSTAVVLASAMLLAALTGATGAGAQAPASPGDEELFNLEHVYNFDPEVHDPGRSSSVGSDLEFFTHTVPLRDYETGDLIDEQGTVVEQPVMAERDFAVMGSYQRGGYVFDITDPEDTQFVTRVTCRQDRNDIGIKKFTDPETGETRVVLALTQQSGDPCGAGDDDDGGGVGVRVNRPEELAGFYGATQWAGTAEVDGQEGDFAYAGTGCTLASYAGAGVDGKLALVDKYESQTNPADRCPTFTFKQKMDAAEAAGAIGLVQVDSDDEASAGNALDSGIPGLEISNTDGVPIRDEVLDAESEGVHATLDRESGDAALLGSGSGGIGVFDITDPYEWSPMYGLRTGPGGVHNFIFHPSKPYGYVSNGDIPGLVNDIPIVDFTDLDAPEVLTGRAQTEGGVHDIELSPDGSRAYAASENNYRIYDTSDPANPQLVSRTPNVGSYAHGVFPSPDLELMVTNNESLVLGGFFVPGTGVCPGEGLASYDITDEGNPTGPLGYYTPDVVGRTDERACTSHFGRFAPGTKILSMGWYIAGTRIVDWSDPRNPREVAGAVLEDTETWAAKFHKGPYVYVGDLGRGFDVFRWSGDGRAPWVREADLGIDKTASEDRVRAGGELTYTLDITNEGPDEATGVTVRDELPDGVEVEGVTTSQGSCSEDDGAVACDLGTLAAGDTAEVTIDVTAPESPGPITNVARVSGDVEDPDAGNNRDEERTRVTGPPAGSGKPG